MEVLKPIRTLINKEDKERLKELITLLDNCMVGLDDSVKNYWEEVKTILTNQASVFRNKTHFLEAKVIRKEKEIIRRDNSYGGKAGDESYCVTLDIYDSERTTENTRIWITKHNMDESTRDEQWEKIIVPMRINEKFVFECEKWGTGKYRLRSVERLLAPNG